MPPHRHLAAVTWAVIILLLGCPDDPVGPDDDTASDDDTGDDDASLLGPTDPDWNTDPLGPNLSWTGKLESEHVDMLVGGAAAESQLGDYMLGNSLGRTVLRGMREGNGYVGTPGAIIDMDVTRPDHQPGGDGLVEAVTLLGDGRVFVAQSFEVDVAGGEVDLPAELDLLGTDAPLHLLEAAMEAPGTHEPLGLEIRQSYTIHPESLVFKVETWIRNTTDQSLTIPVGILLLVDRSVFEPFVPGIGFGAGDLSGTFPLAGYQAWNNDQAIALFYPEGEVQVSKLEALGDDIPHIVVRFGTLQLPPGGNDSLVHRMGVARDVSALDHFRKIQGSGIWSTWIEGFARYEGTDSRIRSTRVFLREPDGTPLTVAKTDTLGGYFVAGDDGTYLATCTADGPNRWVDLAPGVGAYGIYADPGRNELALRGWTEPTSSALLPLADGHPPPDSATVELEPGRYWQPWEVEQSAILALRVVDEDGVPIPAVVRIELPGADPYPPRAELGEQRPAPGVRKVAWLLDGEADVPIPAGSYDLLAHRGLQYETDRVEGVDLEPDEVREVTLTLEQAYDATGYLAADLSSHASPSMDSLVTPQHRLVMAAANGIEVHVAAEADQVADYRPLVDVMGLDGWLTTVPGVELSSMHRGRFLAFPQEPDPAAPGGGAVRWWESGGTTAALVDDLRDGLGGGAVVVAAGRSDRGMLTLGGYEPGNGEPADPSRHTEDFDALELVTGAASAETGELLADWCSFLDRGMTPAAVGSSGAVDGNPGGTLARTYLALGDDPTQVAGDDVAAAVVGGRAVVSAGPFIELTAVDGGGDSAGPGGTVDAGAVTLSIRVLGPSWVEIDQVQVIGPGCAPVATFAVDPGDYTSPVWFEDQVEVSGSAGDYFLVEATGSAAMDPVWPDATPYAVTNPVYLSSP